MKLSKERLEELKQIYEPKYERELTDTEASEIGKNLLRLFAALAKYDREDKERENNEKSE